MEMIIIENDRDILVDTSLVVLYDILANSDCFKRSDFGV